MTPKLLWTGLSLTHTHASVKDKPPIEMEPIMLCLDERIETNDNEL